MNRFLLDSCHFEKRSTVRTASGYPMIPHLSQVAERSRQDCDFAVAFQDSTNEVNGPRPGAAGFRAANDRFKTHLQAPDERPTRPKPPRNEGSSRAREAAIGITEVFTSLGQSSALSREPAIAVGSVAPERMDDCFLRCAAAAPKCHLGCLKCCGSERQDRATSALGSDQPLPVVAWFAVSVLMPDGGFEPFCDLRAPRGMRPEGRKGRRSA